MEGKHEMFGIRASDGSSHLEYDDSQQQQHRTSPFTAAGGLLGQKEEEELVGSETNALHCLIDDEDLAHA